MRNLLRRAYIHLWVLPRLHRRYSKLSLQETFQNIYRTQAWGGKEKAFCSGSGSQGSAQEKYCALIIHLIRESNIRSVLDLGCGDFTTGRKIVEATEVQYTGVDVVPELIAHHCENVHLPNVSFLHADITKDPLPPAELVLIRQVFQHLSNDAILRALENLKSYRRLLISEHVPERPKSFNRDKQTGPDIRSYYGSGVFVEKPPFSLPVSRSWEIAMSEGVLRNSLISREE